MANESTSLLKPDDYEWTWDDFEDWEKANSGFKTGLPKNETIILSREQKEIVENNIRYLEEAEAWFQRVKSFELLLEKEFPQEEKREQERKRFHIRFDNAVLLNEIEVMATIFPCSVYFLKSEFISEVNFSLVEFKGHAYFTGAIFMKNVLFNLVTCKHGVFLEKAICEKKFDVQNINMYSTKTSIHGFISEDMIIKGDFLISSTITETVFCGLNVAGKIDLSGSIFETVPDFRDCKFGLSPEVAGMIVPPPAMSFKIKNEQGNKKSHWPFKLAQDENDVAKYRKLKAMALAANDHEKDGEFFAYEMMAKRGHETKGFWPLLFNSFYWWISDYGQSFTKPLFGMLLSFIAFGLCYFEIAKQYFTLSTASIFASLLSLKSFVPFLGSLFRYSPTNTEDHPNWFTQQMHDFNHAAGDAEILHGLSFSQQLIGLVLLFFFLLALRNKFRLK